MLIEHHTPRPPRSGVPRWTWVMVGAMFISACAFGAGFLYNYPPINWRVALLFARVRDVVNPPPETIPTPSTQIAFQPTFALVPATPTPSPLAGGAEGGTPTPAAPTETIAPSLPPPPTVSALTPSGFLPTSPPLVTAELPRLVKLRGARQEFQRLNNCGPAALVADLTFWGWQGREPLVQGQDIRWQDEIAGVLKPIQRDYNVMPYELASYATDYAGLNVAIRYGGDMDTIRLFVANGIPVIIERGFRDEEHETGQGWEGHYSVVTGYDDDSQAVLTQDSYKGPNYWRSYSQIAFDWQAFDYLYMIVYPNERATDVANLLGANADVTQNYVNALAKAQAETQSMPTNEQKAFAWFNVGTSLNLLGRYEEAASAYDQARTYNELPWRMLWYQTGPYRAYYQAGRYDDVIALASSILNVVEIEESYYWRGWASYSKGYVEAAANDFRAALKAHPDWGPALEALNAIGASP